MTLQEKLEALRNRAPKQVLDVDSAYEKLRKEHYEIYHYIKFESPIPYCPIQTLQNLHLLGPNYTVQKFVDSLQRDALRLYGDGYPLPNPPKCARLVSKEWF